MTLLLQVNDLSASFGSKGNLIHAVKGITFSVTKGEVVALVGESGSGKSVTALSIMQLLPYPMAQHPTGSIEYKGLELVGCSDKTLRKIRGDQISMIFQEPHSSLNPLHAIGKQISEVLFLHKNMTHNQAHQRIVELLTLVGLKEAIARLNALPHEFSGGQQQRIVMAIALANEPELLIADEPTTALDVTVQAQVLQSLKLLQKKLGMAVLFITHDLGVVRKMADRVCVMKGGKIIEQGTVKSIFQNPTESYTKQLIRAEPSGSAPRPKKKTPPILSCSNLKVWYPIKKGVLKKTVGYIKAVNGVSLEIREGNTIGIVGESGSGKSSLARAILRLEKSQGTIKFHGQEIQDKKNHEIRPIRREMQIVFQDPFSSLSPRLSVKQIIEEGLIVHDIGKTHSERRDLIGDALTDVGLAPNFQDRYPHEFSGGQRQRISISRALVLKPKFIILDEPTSALDMSVQSQIIKLLHTLQKKYGLAYMFISHDLKVIKAMSHYIIVMKSGKIMEMGEAESIINNPRHAYTQRLMSAAFDLNVYNNKESNI